MSIGRLWRRHRVWIAVATLALGTIGAYVMMRASRGPDATTTYATQATRRGTLSITVAGTGNVEVRDPVEVWPTVGGTIARLSVEEGERVVEGDPIFCLDHGEAEAATARALASLRQAQQGVVQAEAQLAKAENTLGELEERWESQGDATADDDAGTAATGTPTQTGASDEAVTEQDIEVAEEEVRAAQAGLASARSSRASASLAYEQAAEEEEALNLAAPCDGVVWSLGAAVGDTVSPKSGAGGSSAAQSAESGGGSSAPVVIARDGELAVRLSVNEVDVPSLKVGQRAELEFDAVSGLTATGEVADIARDGSVDQGVVTYDVVVSLDVGDKRLKPGMSASATIVTAVQRDVLLVPNAAVKTSDERAYVQVLDPGATSPRDVAVSTGLKGATETVITKGLEEGVLVITKVSEAESGSKGGEEQGGSGRGFFMPGAGPPSGRS